MGVEDAKADSQHESHTSFQETDETEAVVREREEQLREMSQDPLIMDKLVHSLGRPFSVIPFSNPSLFVSFSFFTSTHQRK